MVQEAWKGNFIRVVTKPFQGKNGKAYTWEYVERINSGDIVAIFAVTQDNEVILAKQYRHPQEAHVLELPAGLTDVPGESHEETARRELLEETGYKAHTLTLLQHGPYNSGLSRDRMKVFFAPDVMYTGQVRLDGSEDIEIVKIPVSELASFLTEDHGDYLVDIKVIGALKVLEHKKLIRL